MNNHTPKVPKGHSKYPNGARKTHPEGVSPRVGPLISDPASCSARKSAVQSSKITRENHQTRRRPQGQAEKGAVGSALCGDMQRTSVPFVLVVTESFTSTVGSTIGRVRT